MHDQRLCIGVPSLQHASQVYEASQRPGTASKTWWTLPLPQAPHSEAQLSPIVERSLAVLIKLLHLTDTIAYKCMTLTAVTLWSVLPPQLLHFS